MVSEPISHLPDGAERRIVGLDTARALAIVGMVMVHFGPYNLVAENWREWVYGLSHGRASLLFVVLAGVGMTLMAGQYGQTKWRRAWPLLVGRVAVLLPLGLGLQMLDIGPLVILHYYAMFFVLAAPATFLPGRILLALAGALSLAGPAAYHLIERARPEWVVRYDPVTLTDPPALILRELLFTGSYPAMVWMAPFLFGMWLGRRALNAGGTRIGLFLGGAIVAVLALVLGILSPDTGWWALADATPHSQMCVWLIGGTATATALLAVCLSLTDLLGRLLWPLAAMGQLALTAYVSHLLLLDAAPGVKSNTVESAFITVGLFTLGAMLFAVVWRRRFQRGPLENVLRFPAYCFGRGFGPDR